MNQNDISGAVHGVADEVQAKTGQAREFISDIAGLVNSGLAKAGDEASAAVNTFGDVAADTYEKVQASAQKTGAAVEPFMRERPYAALAISAALGLVIGLLANNRGGPVVYVRPPH